MIKMHKETQNLVTIITPTYNRKDKIKNLYESLKHQTTYEFEWLIVDDGSTDNTEELIKDWCKESPFSIRYYKQENRGKHCALNLGINKIQTAYTFIVDSDDVLTPNAIAKINQDAHKYEDNDSICGLGYLRGYSEEEVIGDYYPENDFIGNFIDIRFRKNINGDKAEVWKTKDLKSCPFPEIKGEKFLGEGYVWCTLALSKQMYFTNSIIYITEYLEGGLSKSGRKLRIMCPIGGMMSSKLMMNEAFDLKNRIKGTLLYISYAKFAQRGIRYMIQDTKRKDLIISNFLFGNCLYLYWKYKYMKDY